MNNFEIGLTVLSAAVYNQGKSPENRITIATSIAGLNAVELVRIPQSLHQASKPRLIAMMERSLLHLQEPIRMNGKTFGIMAT